MPSPLEKHPVLPTQGGSTEPREGPSEGSCIGVGELTKASHPSSPRMLSAAADWTFAHGTTTSEEIVTFHPPGASTPSQPGSLDPGPYWAQQSS